MLATMRPNRGGRWMRLRAVILAEEPWCRRCMRRDRLTPAVTVHHLKPVEAGGSDERDNLEPLCDDCHKETHGSPPRVNVDGWPVA